jgi:DNA-binding LacI/PurR family transcriptional regulator
MSKRRRQRGAGMKPARATLNDVARKTGVSVMTVSNFVRGKPVRAKTKKRVEAAIALLNYRPNRSARSLRLSEESSVGIVIADSDPAFLNDPFISRLVSGLSNYLSNLDYTLDVQGVTPERFSDATILAKLGNAALCAILCGPRSLRRDHLANLQRLGQPIVVFQEVFKSPAPNVAIISQDDLSGGMQLGEHLLGTKVHSVILSDQHWTGAPSSSANADCGIF